MYESEFDTDWDGLDKESALERAFALGVARSLGEPDPEEYERVLGTADTAYQRSLIELSYEEGKRKASGRTAEESETVWDDLVADTADIDVDTADDSSTRDGPPGMMSRPDPTAVPDDGLDRIRLPEFLRRR
ncbi:MAG: hypothetical protein ABEI80_05565 [Haloplanus sp.]